MLTVDQLKDLALFTAYKAMQLELTLAHQHRLNSDLADQVAKLSAAPKAPRPDEGREAA